MSEFAHNLWAPWRMEYIESLGEGSPSGCFLCDYRDHPEDDVRHHVLCRSSDTIVVMNRFPYTNGHLLIAPMAHKAALGDLTGPETTRLWRFTSEAIELLQEAVSAQGFNVGMNFGLCAGAGLPDHLHVHVVPRWNGDTNFMAVLGDIRVVPQALDRLYEKLRDLRERRGLLRDDG